MIYRQPFVGEYPISQKYGEIVPGVTKNNKPHTGIDYACPEGTRILASADGEVMFAGWEPTGYGYCVILQHAPNRATLYAHLQGPCVRVAQKVKQGDVIGVSGWTGNVHPEGPAGAHLHFEARTKWNSYLSDFDPMLLPLMSIDDSVAVAKNETTTQQDLHKLKEAADLGELVEVVCPDGAKVFSAPSWAMQYYGFPQGTKLHFTGKTFERPGFPQYTYCEVYEEPKKYYVAVHNGQTQILDNVEDSE